MKQLIHFMLISCTAVAIYPVCDSLESIVTTTSGFQDEATDTDSLETTKLPKDKVEYWFEKDSTNWEGGHFFGPYVLRKKGGCVFAWSIDSSEFYLVNDHTPYMLIIEDADAFSVLTKTEKLAIGWGERWVSTQYFQIGEFQGSVSYTYEIDLPRQEQEDEHASKPMVEVDEDTEEVIYVCDKQIDINKGRVFVVSKSNDEYSIRQVDTAIPGEDLRELAGSGREDNEERLYEMLNNWRMTLN